MKRMMETKWIVKLFKRNGYGLMVSGRMGRRVFVGGHKALGTMFIGTHDNDPTIGLQVVFLPFISNGNFT